MVIKYHNCPKHGKEKCGKIMLLARIFHTTESHSCITGYRKWIPFPFPPYWSEIING